MLFPREIAIRPSRTLTAGLVVGHLALGVAFVASSLSPILAGVALAGLLGSCIVALRRWQYQARTRFSLRFDGSIQVTPPDGAPYDARADAGCREWAWGVWLAWRGEAAGSAKPQTRRGLMMIPRDALATEDWRALKIWLRYRAEHAGGPAGN